MAKGSDNPFPSVLLVEGAAPASPPAGDQRLFLDTADHKPKLVNSSGIVTPLPGTELGYTEVTSAQTISTPIGSWIDVTGLSVTVTIGSRPVNILVEFAYVTLNTSGHTYNFGLYDVTAAAFVMIWGTTAAVANQAQHVQFYRRHNPAAGSRTYKVQAFLNNAGDTIVTPGLTDRPTSIQVVQL
jgi:hypothetical protein